MKRQMIFGASLCLLTAWLLTGCQGAHSPTLRHATIVATPPVATNDAGPAALTPSLPPEILSTAEASDIEMVTGTVATSPAAPDTLGWPVYASDERGLQLRYPPTWFYVEDEFASAATLWEWKVNFFDQRYRQERPPQTPGVWISAYPNPEGTSAAGCLAHHGTLAPFGTEVDLEPPVYYLWPGEPVESVTVGGRSERHFVSDAMGLRIPTVLVAHEGWMLEMACGDFGPDELEPIFVAMLQTLEFRPTTGLAPGVDMVIDCAAVYPGLPGCLQDVSLVGGRLAFVDARPSFNYRTTVLDLAGGGAWTLGESPSAPRGWSPSGEYLLTTLGEGASAVYGYQGDSVATYGIPAPTPPFWAPADAFSGAQDWLARPTEDGALVAIPFPEGQPRQVLPPGTLGDSRLVNVRWSADGWLAWTLDPDQLAEMGQWEQMLYVRPADDGAEATAWRLSDDVRETCYQIIDWAPGTRLILAGRGLLSASLFEDGGELVTINTDTGEITELDVVMLLTPEAYAWHPTRPGLLALAEGSGRFPFANKRLALLDVTTGDLHILTDEEMAAFEPAWSPDEKLLAYAAVPASPDAHGDGETLEHALDGRAIYVVDPDTGESHALTDPGKAVDGWPQWSADGTRLLYTRQHDGYTDVRVVALDGTSDELLVTGLADPTCYYHGCYWQRMLTYSPVAPAETSVPTPTATPVLSEMELDTWSFTSPDKKWSVQGTVALPVVGGENYYTGLKVKQTDGTVEWIVVDEWSEWGLGYTTPHPLHWSRNGRYLYYTNRPVPDGCGVFVNGSDLHRVDLSDGSVTEIIPHSGLWLSLSPDEKMLAYVGYAGRGLVLRDLETGAERETKLNPGQDYAAGHIIWSPDGTVLVLTLAFRPCSTDWAESTSVVRVEISSLRQTTLIREDKRLFVTVEWPTLDQVLLRDDEGGSWAMDPRTGQVTKPADALRITPAPLSTDTLLLAYRDGALVLHDLASGRERVLLEQYGVSGDAHLIPVGWPVRLSSDERWLLVPTSGDGTWLVSLDGQTRRQISPERLTATWAPDSRRIVFSGEKRQGERAQDREVYVQDIVGEGAPRLLARLPASVQYPTWSPGCDGGADKGKGDCGRSVVAFTCEIGDIYACTVWLIDIVSSEVTALGKFSPQPMMGHPRMIHWSPCGDEVWVSARFGARAFPMDGSGPRPLVNTYPPHPGVLSPDGRLRAWIQRSSIQKDNLSRLVVARTDSDASVTFESAFEQVEGMYWTDDGRRVLIKSYTGRDDTLWVVDPAVGQPELVAKAIFLGTLGQLSARSTEIGLRQATLRALPAPDDVSRWTTHELPDFGLRLRTPGRWRFEVRGSGITQTVRLANFQGSDGSASLGDDQIEITLQFISFPPSPADFTTWLSQTVQMEQNQVTAQAMELAGRPAARVRAIVSPVSEQVRVPLEEGELWITRCPISSTQDAVFEAILDTLEWTDCYSPLPYFPLSLGNRGPRLSFSFGSTR